MFWHSSRRVLLRVGRRCQRCPSVCYAAIVCLPAALSGQLYQMYGSDSKEILSYLT
jgi:hypothetical protein